MFCSSGYPGPHGLPGVDAPPGEKGISGFNGFPGVPGAKGFKGNAGSHGFRGSYGVSGKKGTGEKYYIISKLSLNNCCLQLFNKFKGQCKLELLTRQKAVL